MGDSTSKVVWKSSECHVGGNIMNNKHDKLTQFYANNIINQKTKNKQETWVPDTGETQHYIKADAPNWPSINMRPPINVGYPNGQTMW